MLRNRQGEATRKPRNRKPNQMNKPQRITNLFAYDFNGNPSAVITKKNTYTFDQYEPTHTAWMRREDGIRGSLKIDCDARHGGSVATFSPANFA